MTTTNKDFIVKNGLIVEGNSATVNGNQVITSADAANYALLNAANTFTGGVQQITTASDATVGLIVKATASQTANLQEWQNSSSQVLAEVDNIGNIKSTNLEIIPLDNLYYKFDGIESRFYPTWQGITQTITNPFRLLITINGIIQSISLPEYVWGSPFSYDGLMLDSDGYMAFSEVLPVGTTFTGRIEAGNKISSTTYSYPFKAIDILLGAY